LGLAQAALAGAGAAAGAGAGAACGAAGLLGGVCDQAKPDAYSETAPAKINPAAIRMVFPLR
jgi:hypothetical protein